jgi:hypothetical protein
MRLEELGQLKSSNNFIENGTRDFPACSIVPQSTTLPRALQRELNRGFQFLKWQAGTNNSAVCI